jgi:hypothetical protein
MADVKRYIVLIFLLYFSHLAKAQSIFDNDTVEYVMLKTDYVNGKQFEKYCHYQFDYRDTLDFRDTSKYRTTGRAYLIDESNVGTRISCDTIRMYYRAHRDEAKRVFFYKRIEMDNELPQDFFEEKRRVAKYDTPSSMLFLKGEYIYMGDYPPFVATKTSNSICYRFIADENPGGKPSWYERITYLATHFCQPLDKRRLVMPPKEARRNPFVICPRLVVDLFDSLSSNYSNDTVIDFGNTKINCYVVDLYSRSYEAGRAIYYRTCVDKISLIPVMMDCIEYSGIPNDYILAPKTKYVIFPVKI